MAKPKLAEKGDNSKLAQLQEETLVEFAKQQQIIDRAKGKQKDALNNGKVGGVLKSAVRKAYKQLTESEAQAQARKEVDQQVNEIFTLGEQLDMFHRSAIGSGE